MNEVGFTGENTLDDCSKSRPERGRYCDGDTQGDRNYAQNCRP